VNSDSSDLDVVTSDKDTSISIYVTGGTFDKEYNEISGSLYFKDTHLPEMLGLGRCRQNVEIRTLMMIDSIDMSDAAGKNDCPDWRHDSI